MWHHKNDVGTHHWDYPTASLIETIKASLDFDLYGRGLQPVADKSKVLAPYRYFISATPTTIE
jgi:hypothetical protein